ncbi:MAG: 50S ribosomal protein L11 methyltransferase [Verrucomicrobia bacterium]|nr:50S ribosomal protein L11 methyltransferase [Verrucomicrobiota bacterium]
MLVWRKISTQKWLDSWQERLAFLGRERLAISQFTSARKVRLEVFDVTVNESALLLRCFGGEVRDLNHSTADWVRSVVSRKPISIRGRLRIVNDEPIRGTVRDLNTIYIPANLAFGTGEHATTAGCLRLLIDLAPKKRDWEFLDAGTGTGILAIAALRLGAKRALGFDFDATAIRVAKTNAHLNKANGLKLFRADVLKYTPEGSFDLAAANLHSELFRKAAARLWPAIKPEGRLIISGLMRDQIEATSEKILDLGGQIEMTRTRGKWVTMVAHRTEI